MNTLIENIATTQKPKAPLTPEQEGFYSSCVRLLATFVGPDFLDIPLLKDHAYDEDGLFYAIPYLDNPKFEVNHASHTLMVVYKVKNRGATCPARIAFEFTGDNQFQIVAIDQQTEKPSRFVMAKGVGHKGLSVVQNVELMKLSQFVTTQINN